MEAEIICKNKHLSMKPPWAFLESILLVPMVVLQHVIPCFVNNLSEQISRQLSILPHFFPAEINPNHLFQKFGNMLLFQQTSMIAVPQWQKLQSTE